MEIVTFIMVISMLFAFLFAVAIVIDIIGTVWAKLRNKPYEWKSARLFKETANWKTALLLAAVVLVGTYCIVKGYGQACSLEAASEQSSELESTEPTIISAVCDYCFESFPEEYAYHKIEGDAESYALAAAKEAAFNASYEAELSGDPLSQGEVNKIYDEAYQEAYEYASKNTICPKCVYGDYRGIVSEKEGKCWKCGRFYRLIDAYGLGMCATCGNSFVSECTSCGMPAMRWENDRGFTLCHECMGEAYQDQRVERAIDAWFEG